MSEAPPVAEGRWTRVRRWLPLVLLLGISGFVLVSGAAQILSLDRLLASRAWLRGLVEADYVRALAAAYGLYVGAVVVSVPATLILTMICGFLFGIVPGALTAVCAATTGAAIVFTVGRGPGADLLRRMGGNRLAGLAAGFRRDAFGYIVVLRLLPLFPFWVTNLAPAAFGVRMWVFVSATVLGLLPGAFVYATTGAGIEEVVAAHEAARAACLAADGSGCDRALTLRDLITPRMVAGLAMLGVFALASMVLSRRARRG
ncbi:VTT domain-containing protein [Methylobacterium sp. J-026]|uniref:TVP38/TMEM64 family protein n=1 Tax=Methylobacterium sp. J-026 TaxID=2836624 RepID=UPI001FB9AB69|nr:VTT domain-containing protein [Methylobacterium sp. J-026]MCJ2133700.1 VTT domain-containing protein [Methylobacterium sp. J-026]